VVVIKEEVAVGRKGSGGAWGSTSRDVGLAGVLVRPCMDTPSELPPDLEIRLYCGV
jgi:hypothetical protein